MHILKKLKKEDIYRVKSPNPNKDELLKIEGSSNNTVRLNSKDDSAYLALGQHYRDQGRYAESEQALKKAIDLNPKNEFAYTELGQFYKNQERYAEAEQILNKAIESNPKHGPAYVELGRLYKDQKNYIEAEQILNKAIGLNLESDQIYIMLGQVYKEQKRLTESKQAFKKAIELNPENELAYGGLATIYGEIGQDELSKVYAEKADKLRDKFNNPVTLNNYRELKQILDKRKIKLVCVQYPMRSIAPLKKIFKEDENIIFVDNERLFKDAVRKDGYNAYFQDMFGGDFGHCTQKGNRLLAQNIANVILKEIFGK
jgi:tetratricopeptide (TPR) repeat protein